MAETGAGSLYGENVYGGVPFGEKNYGSFKYGDKIYYGFDPANTIFYEYDAGDRLTKISYPAPPNAPSLPGGAPAPRMDIGYEYFDDNKIRKITDVAGNDRVYSYDEKDRLASVTMCGKTVTYHYDDDDENYGRLDYILLPNGIKKEYIFNEDESMTGMKYTKNDGAVTLYRFDYVYGNNGNIIKQTITNPSGIQTVYNYNYDPINRLVNVSKNNSEKTWYDFDPMGNRLRKKMSGIVEKTENYDYNACDELRCMDETIFEFDMNGNMTKKTDPSEGTTEYIFDYAKILSEIVHPDKTKSRYSYNSRGLRIKKTDKTGNTSYFYWDEELLADAFNEADQSGNIINSYFPWVGFRSVYNNSQWRFFITDHLNSVVALCNESGEITDKYEYDIYGSILNSNGTSYNPGYYCGQTWDEEAKLYYIRQRYYAPDLGRFTKRDPIGIQDGLNEYIYSGNNAMSYSDISGLAMSGPPPETVTITFVPPTNNPGGNATLTWDWLPTDRTATGYFYGVLRAKFSVQKWGKRFGEYLNANGVYDGKLHRQDRRIYGEFQFQNIPPHLVSELKTWDNVCEKQFFDLKATVTFQWFRGFVFPSTAQVGTWILKQNYISRQ